MDKLRAALTDAARRSARGTSCWRATRRRWAITPPPIAAQRTVIALKGEAATGEDHAALAEVMILAAGGYVSPEAEAELTAALQRDPLNGTATYYAGPDVRADRAARPRLRALGAAA